MISNRCFGLIIKINLKEDRLESKLLEKWEVMELSTVA